MNICSKELYNFTGKDSLIFHTDGTLKEGTFGAGTFYLNPNVEISTPLEIYATIFQAKIWAIITPAISIRKGDTDNKTTFSVPIVKQLFQSSTLHRKNSTDLNGDTEQWQTKFLWQRTPNKMDQLGNVQGSKSHNEI